MPADRLPSRRLYLVDVFALANLALIVLLAGDGGSTILKTLPSTVVTVGVSVGLQMLAGIGFRGIVMYFRGKPRLYFRRITGAGWLTDTVRLLFTGAVIAHTYAWIKLIVPVLHPRLYDQELWNVDQALLAGYSPNILFLTLFGQPATLRIIDWSYARIFFASLAVAFGFFMSDPARRVRLGFMTGNGFMWITGAWLYMMIPSLGPAYRFPDVWLPLSALLPVTLFAQAALMKNYQKVLGLMAGQAVDIQIMFGVAAFPSLHVGFQTFVLLWMRRLWIYGQIVFGVFALTILIGSVVTGWHYLIDGIAGILLAVISYAMTARMWRIRRWLHLRALLRAR